MIYVIYLFMVFTQAGVRFETGSRVIKGYDFDQIFFHNVLEQPVRIKSVSDSSDAITSSTTSGNSESDFSILTIFTGF